MRPALLTSLSGGSEVTDIAAYLWRRRSVSALAWSKLPQLPAAIKANSSAIGRDQRGVKGAAARASQQCFYSCSAV